MSTHIFKTNRRIGFIGCGNMAQSMMRAFLSAQVVANENLFCTNRTEKKLERFAADTGITQLKNNEALIEQCELVFLAMKPQDLYAAIEPVSSSFGDHHIVASLAAGISLDSIQKLVQNTNKILRVMPNTAAKISQSVVAYACTGAVVPHLGWIEDVLESMGMVVPVEDGDMIEAITVASSSGIGFVFELMNYWQEWLEERGFESDIAKAITVQTFKGAAALAEHHKEWNFEELIRRVASTKGVTAAGLDSIRELEIERALRISFEKAAMRDKELGGTWQKSR
jgi:pyrroline-5-carboxylate reductase